MGLFVDRQYNQQTSSSNTNFVGTNCGRYYGSYSFGHMLLESLPSLFMYGVQQFGESDSVDDGKGGKTDTDTPDATTTDNSAEIAAKNKELEEVFRAASSGYSPAITSTEDIEAAISNLDDPDKCANTNIKNLYVQLNELKSSVEGNESSTSILNTLNDVYSDAPTCNQLIEGKTELPNKQEIIQKYNNAKNTEDVLIPQKEKELNEAKEAEKIRLTALLGQAQNINDEILKLKNQATAEDKGYDVNKETNDIKEFMQKLNEFQSATTPQQRQIAAQALKSAFEQGDETNGAQGVQQATVKKAYDMITSKYPDLFV